MPKPTTYATPICLVLSVLAIIGIVIGFLTMNPIYPVLFLLPAVGYEAYRTEGPSTKWSSWLLLIVLILEIIFIIFKISYNLAAFFGRESAYVGMSYVPLGDIKIVGPAIMAVLSVVLFLRTAGIYTKWLAVVIFLTAFTTIYIMDSAIFRELLKNGISNIFWYI